MALRTVLYLLLLIGAFEKVRGIQCYFGNEINITRHFPYGMGLCQAEIACVEITTELDKLQYLAGCDKPCRLLDEHSWPYCHECHTDFCNTQYGRLVQKSASEPICYRSDYYGTREVRCPVNEVCGWALMPDPDAGVGNNSADQMLAFQGCSGACVGMFGVNCTECDTDRCNEIVIPDGVNIAFKSFDGEYVVHDDKLHYFQRMADEGQADSGGSSVMLSGLPATAALALISTLGAAVSAMAVASFA